MKKQVDKKHYNFNSYCFEGRFVSYWYQLKEIFALSPSSILEIGPGDRVFENYIKNNSNIEYRSLDIAEDLHPDIIANIENIPLEDNSFDIVCAFEVLEHLPFEKLSQVLQELKRVTKKYVIISVPHWGRHFALELKLPFFRQIRLQYKFFWWPIKHKFNGQHYWEIGKKGYSLKKVKKIIEEEGLNIKKDYVVFNSPYHHFFVLKK